MELELTSLMSAIGQAVRDAQSCLDRRAVADYCAYFQGQSGENGVESLDLTPVRRYFTLPGEGGGRRLEVPEVALARHDTVMLDTVHVSLNVLASLRKEDGAVMVEVGPGGGEGEKPPYSRIELTFRGAPPSEGIARISQDACKMF